MDRIYRIGGYLLVLAMTIQIYAAGWGLFGAGSMKFHSQFGYAVIAVGLILLLLLAIRRPPRRETLCWTAVVVLVFLQPVLVLVVRRSSVAVAALHATNAVVAVVLALYALQLAARRHPSHRAS